MPWTRDEICKIAAQEEIKGGEYINLGIGIPTLVANHIPFGCNVVLQSENGMLGMGPFPTEQTVDADLINAGKQTISELDCSSYFSSAESFEMIRGKHVDLTILGAMEVAGNGDIANWCIPGKLVKGMGGAMDLVAGAKRVIVLMDHCSKSGEPKLLKECKLPLTGKNCVDRVYSDMGIFDLKEGKAILVSKPADITFNDIRSKTEAEVVDGIQAKAA